MPCLPARLLPFPLLAFPGGRLPGKPLSPCPPACPPPPTRPRGPPFSPPSPVVHEVHRHVERLPVQQAVHPVEPGVVEVVKCHYAGRHVGELWAGAELERRAASGPACSVQRRCAPALGELRRELEFHQGKAAAARLAQPSPTSRLSSCEQARLASPRGSPGVPRRRACRGQSHRAGPPPRKRPP